MIIRISKVSRVQFAVNIKKSEIIEKTFETSWFKDIEGEILKSIREKQFRWKCFIFYMKKLFVSLGLWK